MDYKKNLSYLFRLQFVARRFGYLNSTLPVMLEEKKHAEVNLKWSQKQWLTKLFDNDLYHDRIFNNQMELDRVSAIIQILEANPNKEQSVTLGKIIDDAIAKASKHVSKEEIDKMHHNDSVRSFYRGGDRNIGINAAPEHVYFEEEAQKPVDTTKIVYEPLNKQATSAKNLNDELVK